MGNTKLKWQFCAAGIVLAITVLASSPALAQQDNGKSGPVVAPPTIPPPPAPAIYKLDEAYLNWNLAPKDRKYADIDGRQLKQYVLDQTAISRRYHDQGHQFWGRIIGTQADAEDAEWLMGKFRAAGLSDVHLQSFDLPPQWMPQSWSITASGDGRTLQLQAVQPDYLSPGTSPEGRDLEVVYVGLGSEADFRGRDVRGKAVLLFSMPQPDSLWNSAADNGALARAEAKGAAAILEVIAVPGNFRMQLYPKGNRIPAFSIGYEDGNALRNLIAAMPPGQDPVVKIRLDVQRVPGLKTATVWGTLPGMTDETIYVVAHRDGWFEGANDNASGIAAMIGLAEYFAKIPKEQRRRTIVFLGTSGHHNGMAASASWLAAHKELLSKTALMINCEHTAGVQAYLRGPYIREANETDAFTWYVGGSAQLARIVTGAYRDFGVATYAYPEGNAGGEMGPFYKDAPSIQVLQGGLFFHSDHDTADKVTPTGLAAITRAYAKIIDGVNKLDRKELLRSAEPIIIYR